MRYLFSNCVLDVDRRELCRATDLVRVEPQVFDLLVYLIRNRERVVSKDDLLAAIWHGRIVSESTLNTRISAARSAVGDSGDDQRLIKTLPRKGIRFVGVVREDEESAVSETDLALDGAQVAEAATEATAPRRSDQLQQAVRTKVLIIDDHALIREALRSVLNELQPGVVILEAMHAREGMRLAAANCDLNLVLLDLGLPDGDGFELLGGLRERHPTFPVVVISGYDDWANVVRAFDLGALGFVPKTAQRPILLNALRLVLAGGVYIPPEILRRQDRMGATAHPARKPATSPSDLGLTNKQAEVLALMTQGKSDKAIGLALGLAEPTVRIHVTAILNALKVSSRTEVAGAVVELGLDLATAARS